MTRPSSRNSRSFGRLAAIIVAVAAGLVFAGCGGSSSPDRDADGQELDQIAFDLGSITNKGDVNAFCELFSPAALKEADVTTADCVQTFRPLMKQLKKRRKFEVKQVVFDGDTAVVTFKRGYGEAGFEKHDGDWYLSPPQLDDVSQGQSDS